MLAGLRLRGGISRSRLRAGEYHAGHGNCRHYAIHRNSPTDENGAADRSSRWRYVPVLIGTQRCPAVGTLPHLAPPPGNSPEPAQVSTAHAQRGGKRATHDRLLSRLISPRTATAFPHPFENNAPC